MRRRRGGSVRNHQDRGAVLLIAALAMVAVLVIAAIVIDLGQLRGTRRSSQSAADLAALSAGFYLSGHGSAEPQSDPRAACRAALGSLRTNIDNLPDTTSLDCDALPAMGTAPGCTSSTMPVTLTAASAAPYAITIVYPVPSSQLSDLRFSGGVGALDGASACQRMSIRVERTNEAIFAGIVGVSAMTSGATAIVRANTSQLGDGAAALLLLERRGCGTLQHSGGGSGGGILVQSAGPQHPGVIHSDSAGIVGSSACTTNVNASGYVIYGTALPSGGPSIIAEPSSGGMPGIVGLRSLAIGGRGAAVEGSGVSPAATAAEIMSRRVADQKYNKPVAQDGRAQISAIHTRGYQASTMTVATAQQQGFRVITDCSLDTDVTPVLDEKVFFDCSTFNATRVLLPNATTVVFRGKVDFPSSGGLLSLPNARRIYVRGCATSCGGANNFAVRVNGNSELRVNTGGDGTTTPTCASRASATNWTELATFGGPMLVTGQIRLCQTFVYLGENQSTYARRTVTTTGASASHPDGGSYPAAAMCSEQLPCPSANGGPAYIEISGGAGNADWSAPNQLNRQPKPADFDLYPFEDLSLWSESHAASAIKGQGANRTEGVFFMPNSAMTFTGQATQSQPLNAQFISRTLNLSGQGLLNLKPNPEDAVVTPVAGTATLIR